MMLTRRSALLALALTPGIGAASAGEFVPETWLMPDESYRHKRTWMAFGASKKIHGRYYVEVQDALALIAKTVADYEPVTMLVRQEEMGIAQKKCGPNVTFLSCPLDDLWMRDSGPVFVTNSKGHLAAIDFNFNGWGNKQIHSQDKAVAKIVAQASEAAPINTSLVLEGGGIEVDGNGTAILAESCILNANRNPGLTKEACETKLKSLLGLSKIIWVPGEAGMDITDGHIDFYARFVRAGVVAVHCAAPHTSDHAVSLKNIEILKQATDANGNILQVEVIDAPFSSGKIPQGYDEAEFAAGYLNYYIVNGAVISAKFGDIIADKKARATLARLFPERTIVQINVNAIAGAGGGIHCTTQQEPAI